MQDLHADLAQRLERRARRAGLLDQDRLGDLERRGARAAGRRPRAPRAPRARNSGSRELLAGDVDRDAHRDVGEALGPAGHLGDGALEHPAPERRDEPGLLGQRDELDRADDPARRVLPAHERLDGDRAQRGRVEDRLVEDAELVALQRAAQVGLECAGARARRGASPRRTLRRARGRAPWRGTSRRRPRAAVFAGACAVAPDGDADRRRAEDLAGGDGERARAGLGDALGDLEAPSSSDSTSRSTTNSSPPRRATRVARRARRRSGAQPTSISSSSPASWPSESLTVLKRSRSRSSTATPKPTRAARAEARARRGRRAARGWAGP